MTINHFQVKILSDMSDSFQKKCSDLKKIFAPLSTEERYQKLMEMGKKLLPFPDAFKTAENRVSGCQSILYLYSEYREGKLIFYAQSDALISAGLAALLINVYSNETPETILKNPPEFIKELGIDASLSLNRSNGLANILLKMKREALRILAVR
jgi:cysteine desulfuration protein SufE